MIPDDFSHERADRARELEGRKRLFIALEEKTDEFYGYFNNHYSGHSPTTAGRFIKNVEFITGDLDARRRIGKLPPFITPEKYKPHYR